MKQTRSPLYPIFLFVIINLIIFTLSRLGLAIWQADRVSAVAGWGQLFLQGLLCVIYLVCLHYLRCYFIIAVFGK